MENQDAKIIRKYLNLIESIENKLTETSTLLERSALTALAKGELAGKAALTSKELQSIFSKLQANSVVGPQLKGLGVKSTDELLKFIKNDFRFVDPKLGSLSKMEAGYMRASIELEVLKSGQSSAGLLDAVASNLVKDTRFIQQTKQFDDVALINHLKKKHGFSDQGAKAVVRQRTLGKQGKLTPNTKPTNTPKPPNTPTPPPTFIDKIKNFNWAKAAGYAILVGVPLAGLWWWWNESGKDKEGLPPQPPQEFPPCAKSLLTNKQGVTAISPKGEISILVKQTGVVAYDGVGGLRFYSNGRVFTADNSKRGTYTCKGTEVAVQEENKNLSEEDVLGMSITWDSKTTPNPGETPAPGTKSTYRNCTDFPYTFGCRSQVIKEVQVCLGMSPKYQTGNFGPITLKELKSKRGEETITKEVYDSIKQSCQTSTTRPESQYIEPMPSIKSGQIQQPEIQPKTQPSQPSQPSQLNKDFCVALFKNIDDRDQESGRKTANSTEIQQIKDCLQQYNFLFSGSAKMRRRYGLTMSGGDRGIK